MTGLKVPQEDELAEDEELTGQPRTQSLLTQNLCPSIWHFSFTEFLLWKIHETKLSL